MKTTFTLLFVIGLSFSAFAKPGNPFSTKQTSQNRLGFTQLKNGYVDFSPSAITVHSWESGNWNFEYTTTYVYDANGNVLVMTTPESRTTNTYDSYGNLSESIYDAFMDGDWVTVSGSRTLREYDSEGEVISEIYAMYQFGTGWNEFGGYKTERTYSGLLLIQEIEYNRENGVWVPQDKTEYFYDSNNKPNMAREYEHDGDVFVVKGQYTDVDWYLWNGNVNQGSYLLGYIYQTYNGTGDITSTDSYTDYEKMVATYEGIPVNGVPPIMKQTEYLWMDSEWTIAYYNETHITPTLFYYIEHTYTLGALVRVDRNTQVFDSHKNITEIKQEWHNGDENWVQDDGTKFDITYEGATPKMLQRIIMGWDVFTDMYVNDTRETYEYGATNINTKNVGVSVYPTVVNSEINIVSEQDGMATFYSLTGSVTLQTQVYAGANTVSTSSLPSGYYILKVNDNTFKVIKK